MPSGRPRTPSKIMELRSSHSYSTRSIREGEPKEEDLSPLPPPPPDMDVEVKECWREILSLCHQDIMCNADALVMEELSYLLFKCRKAKFDVHPGILSRFEACLAKLGMTPADRSRVARLDFQKQHASPFSKFKRAS